MAEDETILEVEALTLGYGERTILSGVEFAVRRGEIFVIMGPSGCGKTTLLKALVGLLEPLEGRVLHRGRDLADPDALGEFRRRVGMVFQGGALLNSVSLQENVALPLEEHTALPPEMIREIVKMKLAQVGLLEFRGLHPVEVSGGMRKRAGIARATALEPEILFFDEPTGGLDPVSADGIDNLVLSLRETLGVTIVIVTHELASIFKVADRVMMLDEGRIAALADPEAVRKIDDESVRQFIDRRAPREEGAADSFLAEVAEEDS